jgi:hypothetical protein
MTALKPGTRVVYQFFGSRKHGVIVKLTKLTARIRFDDTAAVENLYLERLRAETAEDVARRDHDRAMRAWRDARPVTKIAHVERSRSFDNSEEIGASVHLVSTPEEMRTAASDLQLLAIWFAARPVYP